MSLYTPGLKAGGTVAQTLTVHMEHPGDVVVGFHPADGMRQWDGAEPGIDITSATSTPKAKCDHSIGINGGLSCTLPAGDSTITYTLKAPSSAFAWRIVAYAGYVIDFDGHVETGDGRTESGFTVDSPHPVPDHHLLFARDAGGTLHEYWGIGSTSEPYETPQPVGRGWQAYTALAALSPVNTQQAGGGVVARDRDGVLWHYRTRAGHYADNIYDPFYSRTKVGGGWNIYNQLTGVQDVTGDGRPDLIARDRNADLWLYAGTDNATDPLAARFKIGYGWNAYTTLLGAGDVTGDRKADLVARDGSGVLWLYRGTGNAATPFATRTRIGGGWNTYTAMAAPGDLNDDYKADLVARDGSGVLWLYRGSGNAAAPYSPRTRIGGGWNAYNHLL
ncbi:VCBS repeat-containing protein [Streptomyces melanogenes]|uniref:VCBS repeat-containing protein n=1 Tax=Streptomyces melanogenes TaxID=67326 RepID=A0ABZ1XXM9_9ACTN|nr:VCBS repeat-containing protein [Streptomyces melanogenes]